MVMVKIFVIGCMLKDHCSAIDLVIHKGKPGEVYNIGGHNERTNIEIVEHILETLRSIKRINYICS